MVSASRKRLARLAAQDSDFSDRLNDLLFSVSHSEPALDSSLLLGFLVTRFDTCFGPDSRRALISSDLLERYSFPIRKARSVGQLLLSRLPFCNGQTQAEVMGDIV